MTTTCLHYQEGVCALGSSIANVPVRPREIDCQHCKQTLGCLVIVLAKGALHEAGKPVSTLDPLVAEYCPKPSPRPIVPGGPGSELNKLIPGFFKKKGCGCADYARKMDRWGVQGCRQRFDEIVNHLVAQAAANTFVGKWKGMTRAVARKWVTQAIEAASEN